MKTICATLFLLGFVSLPLLAQTAVSKAKPSTPVEQEIIELERQWAAVIKSQDISAASRLLSEDLFLSHRRAGSAATNLSKKSMVGDSEILRDRVLQHR